MTGNGQTAGSCLPHAWTNGQRKACHEAPPCNPYDLLSAANPARHAPFFSLAASTQRTYTFAWRQLLQLSAEDIDVSDAGMTIRTPNGKRSEVRSAVAVAPEAAQWLMRWLRASGIQHGAVFRRIDAQSCLQDKPIYNNHATFILREATRRMNVAP